MSEPIYFDDETKEQWQHIMEQARADRERYFNWIKNEINVAIDLINRFDKIYILGALGARLIAASPTFFNQFLETYDGPDKAKMDEDRIEDDDEIEVLLEYAFSLATASPNHNAGITPSAENIAELREQLSRIKLNISIYEMSAEPPKGGTEFDHRLKSLVMQDAMNIRGVGYQVHISELYKETFAAHDGFLIQYYGFNSADIFETIQRLDLLVGSKVGNPMGGAYSHTRWVQWSEDQGGQEAIFKRMRSEGKHFMQLFIEDNPDLYHEGNDEGPTLLYLDDISGYNRLFWVLPRNAKERLIFDKLSHEFGDNADFTQGKFGGFPLGDSVIQTKPLIKVGDRYYAFSLTLPFRNLFNITAALLEAADPIYYEHTFKGNASAISRDNYIEGKVKRLFEKFLPTVQFYHSLKYDTVENGLIKNCELDILGKGTDTLYIIEVKAGELNKKHRRGAILGLKDRLKETVNEGSYQCHRAEKYINENAVPEFTFVDGGQRKALTIDKTQNYQIIKISVMYEHLSTVSVNLKYLIDAGVLSSDYKGTWIVSIYDLMVFADLMENETDFKEYINYRINLYDRNDVEFQDELDIVGFFFDNKFPLPPEKPDERIAMLSHKEEIETYYRRSGVGLPGVEKPKRKT